VVRDGLKGQLEIELTCSSRRGGEREDAGSGSASSRISAGWGVSLTRPPRFPLHGRLCTVWRHPISGRGRNFGTRCDQSA
jgi:hypothetical protein